MKLFRDSHKSVRLAVPFLRDIFAPLSFAEKWEQRRRLFKKLRARECAKVIDVQIPPSRRLQW